MSLSALRGLGSKVRGDMKVKGHCKVNKVILSICNDNLGILRKTIVNSYKIINILF